MAFGLIGFMFYGKHTLKSIHFIETSAEGLFENITYISYHLIQVIKSLYKNTSVQIDT